MLFEKIPFFVLSGISCVLTYLTEEGRPAPGFEASPPLLRLENAFAAYARYLGKTFWPINLAVPYTNPGHWSWLEVGGAVLVVAGVWLAVLWLGRRRPYLLVGWCWFWGTLIPVIGLTRGWGSFMADRFTYLPSIGVLMLIVWGVGELTRGWRYRAPAFSVAGGAAIICCLALTRRQLGYWKDSETLFRHALEATGENVVAHNDLGNALFTNGQVDEAMGHYREALRLKADYAEAYYNLGGAFDKQGQMAEAIRHYQEAIRLKPEYADAHNNLGIVFYQQGRTNEAIRHFQAALRLKPDHAQIRNNLARALDLNAQTNKPTSQLQEDLRRKPDDAEAHYKLGVAFYQQGQTAEAIRQFQEALRLNPDHADARRNLVIALATQGDASRPPGLSTNR